MGSPEYFELLYNYWLTYVFSLLLVFIIYTIILRRYFISILDPTIISFFFSAIAGATIFFLFFLGKIDTDLFIFYLITQSAFLLGFCLFKPIRIERIKIEKREIGALEIRFCKWLYLIISITVITIQLMIYTVKGIPLFAESRLNVIGDDPLFKFLQRVLNISLPVYTFLTVFFLFYFKKKNFFLNLFNKVNILLIIGFSILSGSRGAFFTFGEIFFIYSLYSLRWDDHFLFRKLQKFSFRFIGLATIIALIIIFLGQVKGTNPLFYLFYRFAASGDVFYMTFPNRVLEQLPSQNWFTALFASPLHLLGIINASQVPEPLGYVIMQYHNPYALFLGPNPRQNVFGYVYFGYYIAPLYSFIIGSIFGFIRNTVFFKLPRNIIGCIFYYLLLVFACTLETDFQNSLAYLINIFLILPPIFLLVYYLSLKNTKNAVY